MGDTIKMDISNKKHISMNVHSQDGVGMNINTGGGTKDHSKLKNRDLPDQHPISAITGLEEALNNVSKQIYIGDTEPTDSNILIWIDTSTPPTPPIIGTQLITADNLGFYTKNDEVFILKEEIKSALLTINNEYFITSDNKEFILNEQNSNVLLTFDNKELIEANNKKFILKEEY